MESNQDIQKHSVGVLTVATNLYLDYWKSMVLSAEEVSSEDDKVTFFVFTENPEEAMNFAHKLSNVKVRAFKIPAYSWPDATLLRYQIFHSCLAELTSEILMHLDADMLFRANPWNRVKNSLYRNPVTLVEHPGFWRPRKLERIYLYLRSPRISYRDLRNLATHGALGAWDRNANSTAYTEREQREKYYCGGTWFGSRVAIADLLEILSSKVHEDISNNVTAIWHDESHLNKWATENSFYSENPELCFDESSPQLRKLTPHIVAVRKVEKTR